MHCVLSNSRFRCQWKPLLKAPRRAVVGVPTNDMY